MAKDPVTPVNPIAPWLGGKRNLADATVLQSFAYLFKRKHCYP
jgi:hypothetical protein